MAAANPLIDKEAEEIVKPEVPPSRAAAKALLLAQLGRGDGAFSSEMQAAAIVAMVVLDPVEFTPSLPSGQLHRRPRVATLMAPPGPQNIAGTPTLARSGGRAVPPPAPAPAPAR